MIDLVRANQLFKYDPVTGSIINRTSRKGSKKDGHAGSRSGNTWYVSIDGFRYRLIDIVYFIYRGEFSNEKLYYKDRNSNNHQWINITTDEPDKNLPRGSREVIGTRSLIVMGKESAIVMSEDGNDTHVHSIKSTKRTRVYIKFNNLNPLVKVNTTELYKRYKKAGFVKIVC